MTEPDILAIAVFQRRPGLVLQRSIRVRISEAVGRSGDAAQAVAGELQQTVVAGYKEANGGKLNKDRMAHVKGRELAEN